jgi:hypothetical protein
MLRQLSDAATNLATRVLWALSLVVLLLVPCQAVAARTDVAPEALGATTMRLPLAFAPSIGQLDATVHFQLASPGGALFFMPAPVVLAMATGAERPTNDCPRNQSCCCSLSIRMPRQTLFGSGTAVGSLCGPAARCYGWWRAQSEGQRWLRISG